MKSVALIALSCIMALALFTACGGDQPGQSSADGPLKSTAIYNKHDVRYRVEHFDRDGRKMKVESFYDDGTINKVVYYEYDANGNLVAMTDSSASDYYFYTYDEKNRMTEELNELYGTAYRSTSTYLDEEGLRIDSNHNTGYAAIYHLDDDKVVQWIGLDDSGDTSRVEHSTYDANGNPLSFKAIEHGQLRVNKTYRYNEDGVPLEEILLNTDGTLKEKYAYNYDEEGRITQLLRANVNDEVTYIIEHSYRKNSKITRSGTPGKLIYDGKEEYEYYAE